MTVMEYDDFVDNVRDALTHLYDHVHLQTHPLSILVTGYASLDDVTRAQKLRRVLLEAIEQLSPAAEAPASPEASFSYSALCYRYMDGLGPEEIASILGLSVRQVYRKLREAVEAVASLLWDQMNLNPPDDSAPNPISWDRQSLADATVQQLGSNASFEMLEIGAILGSIEKDLLPYCHQIDAHIILVPPAEPVHVYADRTMLRQAFINLITNGLDKIGVHSMTIRSGQTPGQLHLTLQAQLKAAPRIPASRPAIESEGIGWQVGVQLIEMQGGSVECEISNHLWRVEIKLPVVGHHQILVIDDMPDIINLFQRFTSQYALEVIGAENASEAFKALETFTPSLILLDVMLPKQDGWEILQTLKAEPATTNIPVVICSILNEPGLAIAIGANGYLKKPVSREALLQELSRWLNLFPAPAAGQM